MDSSDQQERTIYVANIDEKVDDKLLEELFVQVGPIESVLVRESKSTGGKSPERSQFAFIEFSHLESVMFACKIMDAVVLYGRKIKVSPRDNTKQKELYLMGGMREKSNELHRENTSVARRSNEEGNIVSSSFAQFNQYPNQPTPINMLNQKFNGTPQLPWSAPPHLMTLPIFKGGLLPPPPPQPVFNSTPKISGERRKFIGNSRSEQGQFQRSHQNFPRHSGGRPSGSDGGSTFHFHSSHNRSQQQPPRFKHVETRHSWPRMYRPSGP